MGWFDGVSSVALGGRASPSRSSRHGDGHKKHRKQPKTGPPTTGSSFGDWAAGISKPNRSTASFFSVNCTSPPTCSPLFTPDDADTPSIALLDVVVPALAAPRLRGAHVRRAAAAAAAAGPPAGDAPAEGVHAGRDAAGDGRRADGAAGAVRAAAAAAGGAGGVGGRGGVDGDGEDVYLSGGRGRWGWEVGEGEVYD